MQQLIGKPARLYAMDGIHQGTITAVEGNIVTVTRDDKPEHKPRFLVGVYLRKAETDENPILYTC